jgi:hypothetical protein
VLSVHSDVMVLSGRSVQVTQFLRGSGFQKNAVFKRMRFSKERGFQGNRIFICSAFSCAVSQVTQLPARTISQSALCQHYIFMGNGDVVVFTEQGFHRTDS